MTEQAENTAPVDAPEVDSEAVPTPGEGSAPSGTEAPASGDDTSTWTEKAQKRYDELTRERYEAAARADRAEYRLQEAERRLQEREAAQAKPETVAPSDDFPTLEACGWDEAELRRKIDAYYDKKLDARAESVLQKRERQAQQQQAGQAHARREAEFIKSKPDYAQKALREPRDGGPIITDAMSDVIVASEIGPDIAYYLGENVAKSAEIARLPPHLQAREIGRIEARLEAAKATAPVSRTPPPPGKIDAADSAPTIKVDTADADTLSDAEWTRRRNAQEQARFRKSRGG